MKIIVLISLLLMVGFMGQSLVSASNASIIYDPVVETVNLLVDGSSSPQTISLTEDFDYVNHVVFVLIWQENSTDYDQFGTHISELENGTLVYYSDSQLFNAITCTKSFESFSYDMDILTDDKNPIENHLIARLSFNNFVGQGLDVRTYDLEFIVQDNNTAYASTFEAQLQGEQMIEVHEKEAPRPILLNNINDFAVEFMKEPLWWIWLLIPIAAVVLLIKHWW